MRRDVDACTHSPDLGDGFCWSSIALSKKRLRSDTDFGTLAGVGGDCTWSDASAERAGRQAGRRAR